MKVEMGTKMSTIDPYEQLKNEMYDIELNETKRIAFVNDPATYLSMAGLVDPYCTFSGKTMKFSQIVGSANQAARAPVARTLLRRMDAATISGDGETKTPIPDPDPDGPLPVGVPLVNAVVVANLIALANGMVVANVNMTYNANTSGANPNVIHDSRRYSSIDFSDDFTKSAVYNEFDIRGYSFVRQGALLKSLIVAQLGDSPENGDYRIRSEYMDMRFELTFDYCSGEIMVKHADLQEIIS
jgi:hypothetical protein